MKTNALKSYVRSQAADWYSTHMTGNAYHICKAKAQTYREVMELIKHRGRLP